VYVHISLSLSLSPSLCLPLSNQISYIIAASYVTVFAPRNILIALVLTPYEKKALKFPSDRRRAIP